jgi:CO/xanthine dehydrogenase Mo-binding subunit
VPPEQVHVVARDIGGNFGTKNSLFPEFPLVLWASTAPSGQMDLRTSEAF